MGLGPLIGNDAPATPELQQWAQRHTVPRAFELFRQGTVLNRVIYVESGAVKLTRVDSDGRENMVELAFAGAWLGTASVVARVPAPLTAVTCDRTVVAQIPSNVFHELLQRNNALSLRMHQFHASELCRHADWISQLSSRTSRQRLQSVMHHLVGALKLNESPDGIRLRLPFHQWELARLIAVTPEHLSRVFKEMIDEGVIRRHKGWIVITNLRRLWPEHDYESS